ncbi:MAG: hypothetical protein AAGC74_02835 [Verrucomicrobiota bacterium]
MLGGGLCAESERRLEQRRLDNKVDRRELEAAFGNRLQGGKEGLDLAVLASIAYDDNIFQGVEGEEVGDVVMQVEPVIGWVMGERGKGTWLRAAYEGAWILYFDNNEADRIDNRLRLEGEFRRKALVLAYSARWAKLGSPSTDVGGTSDRQEWGVRVGIGYDPEGKWAYDLYVERSAVDQDDGDLFDIWETGFGGRATFVYSPKTQVEFELASGTIEVDGTGDQQFTRLSSQFFWRPRPKIAVALQAGLDRRDYVDGSSAEPFYNARVSWTPRTGTSFYLEGYRREQASAALQGENFELFGLRLGTSQRIRDGWSAGLEFCWENAKYFAISGLPESGREDDIIFIRPSLKYQFGEKAEVLVLYQFSQNSSSDPAFGYDNHQFGVSMNYQF